MIGIDGLTASRQQIDRDITAASSECAAGRTVLTARRGRAAAAAAAAAVASSNALRYITFHRINSYLSLCLSVINELVVI